MAAVIDCGCVDWGTERSLDRLIERFQPTVLFGFDPYKEVRSHHYVQGETSVWIEPWAAWVTDGYVWFHDDTTRSHVTTKEPTQRRVRSFDLARMIGEFPEPVILKLDVEGAEHVLIPHLVQSGAIENVSLLLVEFHGEQARPAIPCAWEAWV